MPPALPTIRLKPGREKSLLRHHPWVFDGAIAQVSGEPQLGETVAVLGQTGQPLGVGSFSPRSQIRVRMWSFTPDVAVDQSLMHARIQQAIARRQTFLTPSEQTACRLIAAESDGLPGVVVDRYGPVLVCQFLTAGAEFWREVIVEALANAFPDASLYERSDVDVREKEGLRARSGLLRGADLPDLVTIQEGTMHFLVDVQRGHKTGFYLDQRDNRAAVATLAKGRSMLNCFSYTGGFSVAALLQGASHVLNVDSSPSILALSEKNHQLNHLTASQYDHLEGDVFRLLRQFRDEGRQFDLIVLDPPKFVESQSHLERAARGYKDINRLAFLLLNPGGILATFSCSGLMPVDLFQKIVADAALDAHRDAQILRRLTQAADHPTLLPFPEAFYLKGFLCQVLSS